MGNFCAASPDRNGASRLRTRCPAPWQRLPGRGALARARRARNTRNCGLFGGRPPGPRRAPNTGMKIAFATADGEHVHGELRRSPLLVVYEVTPAGFQLERASAFRDRTARSEDRIGALIGAAVVYVAAIGPSTAARLAARGIRPATAPDGTPIRDLLAA